MARKTSVSVGIRLTADGSQLIGQTRLSREEMRKLGIEFSGSGRKAADFSRGAAKAGQSADQLGRGVSRLRGFLGALGVSLSVVGMQRLVTGTTQALDVVGKLSRTTGIATEDLQRLEFAASQTGLQFNDLTKGLQRFQRRLTEDDSVAEFAASLNLRDLNTTDQLLAIAKQFEGIVDPAERAAAAARLFGRTGGTEMLKLLEEGADGIRQLTGRADELGLVLDGKTIAAAEQFNDSWDEVSRSLSATLRAGVMQGLTNDSDELSESWLGLTSSLTDPALQRSISDITAGFINLTNAVMAVPGFVRWMGESFAALVHGPAADDIVRMSDRLDEISEKLGKLRPTDTALIEQLEHERDLLTERIALYWEFSEAGTDSAETLEKIVVTAEAAGDEWRRLIKEQRDAVLATKTAAREQKQFEAAFGRLRDQLEPAAAATRQYSTQVDLLDRAWAEGMISGEDHWKLLSRIATGAEETTKETDELTQQADPFADAWKRAIEDVDRAFVQLWESAFGGFRSFADQLKRSFQRLLAELAHAAVTRPIMISMGLGGALGAPGAAAAAGGVSGGGLGGFNPINGFSAFAGGGGIASGLNQVFQGSATGPFQGAGGMGLFGGSNLGFGLAGLGGGLIGSQFGGAGGIGGSIGGAAGFGLASGGGAIGSSLAGLGALAGPLGAIGGAIIGGALGSLFGSNPEELKRDELNLSVGDSGVSGERFARTRESGGLFKGSKWRTYTEDLPDEFLEALDAQLSGTMDAVNALLEATGQSMLSGLSTSTTIDVKGLSDTEVEQAVTEWVEGVQEDIIRTAVGSMSGKIGRKVRFAGDLEEQTQMLAALAEVVTFQESLNLGERMGLIFEDLVLAFDGIEDISGMAESLGGLMSARQRDPTSSAASDHELSLRNLGQVYADQVNGVRDLIATYDGSIAATQDLSAAYQVSQQMAHELALGLHQTSAAVDALLGNLSARITEDLIQDEEELYNHRRDRVDMLTEALTGMSSPDEIMRTIEEIERLTAQMWSSLAEEQKQEMGEGFLGFLDEVGGLAQERISGALSDLDDDMSGLGISIDRALEASAMQLRAGQEMAEASRNMLSVGGSLSGLVGVLANALANIRVKVDVAQPEVG